MQTIELKDCQTSDRSASILIVVLCLTLTGCVATDTKQGQGQIGGAGAGTLIGGLIGNELGGTTGAILGALGGAALGGFVGGEIGRRLDEADQERAQAATLEALERSEVTTVAAPSPTLSAPAPAPRPREEIVVPEVTAAPEVAWESEENRGVQGSAQVVEASIEDDGRQCRTVREVAYIQGEELKQNAVFCREARGPWVREETTA